MFCSEFFASQGFVARISFKSRSIAVSETCLNFRSKLCESVACARHLVAALISAFFLIQIRGGVLATLTNARPSLRLSASVEAGY